MQLAIAMNILLKGLMNPVSSLVFTTALCKVLYEQSIVVKVVCAFVAAVAYFIIGPRARRSSKFWSCFGLNRIIIAEGTKTADRTKPTVIVSYPIGGAARDVLSHAFAYSGGAFAHSTTLYVCDSSHEALLYKLPVARSALWLIVGVMQYSRGLLLQLLKRRGNVIAVTLQPQVRGHMASTSRKGLFAAALKSNASIVPALVLTSGDIVLGNAVATSAPTATPSPDQIRALVAEFAVELKSLYKATTGSTLQLINNA